MNKFLTRQPKQIIPIINNLSKICRSSSYYAGTNAGSVSEDSIDEFQRNGVVLLQKMFDKHWLDLAQKGIEKNMREPSKYCDWLLDDDGKGLFFNDYYNYSRFPEYYEYITSSPVSHIAGQLMKSTKTALFHEHVFVKEGGSNRETPWHHDQAYYPINGHKNCSIWMPITKVNKQSSLKFIKGSHKFNKLFIPRLFATNQNYQLQGSEQEEVEDIENITKDIKKQTVLQWDVQPGDCIAFHMKTIHGTNQSMNKDKRMVMSTRWIGDDITYVQRSWKTSPPIELLPADLKIGDLLVDKIRT